MRSKLAVLLALGLVLSQATSALALTFTDVPKNHWAYEAVRKLAAEGLLEGYPGGEFDGLRTLTRYEFAHLIWRVWLRLDERQKNLERSYKAASTRQTTETAAKELAEILRTLLKEFKPELKGSGVSDQKLQTALTDVASRIASLYAAQVQKQAALEGRLAETEKKIADLEKSTAELRKEATPAPKVAVSGGWELDLTDSDVAPVSSAAAAFRDPYEPDYDRDGVKETVPAGKHEFYQGISLNLGFTPAPGAALLGKVRGVKYHLDNKETATSPRDEWRLGMVLQTQGALKLAAFDRLDPSDVASGFSPLILDAGRLTDRLTDPATDEVEPMEGVLGKVQTGDLEGKGLLVYNYPDVGTTTGLSGILVALRPTLAVHPTLRLGATYIKQPDEPLGKPDAVGVDARGQTGSLDYQVDAAVSGSDLSEFALDAKVHANLGLLGLDLERQQYDAGYDAYLAKIWEKDRPVEKDPDALWNPNQGRMRGGATVDLGQAITLSVEAGRREYSLIPASYSDWQQVGLAFPAKSWRTEAWVRLLDNSANVWYKFMGVPNLREYHLGIEPVKASTTTAPQPALKVLVDQVVTEGGTIRTSKRWIEGSQPFTVGKAPFRVEADYGLYTDRTNPVETNPYYLADPYPEVNPGFEDRPHYRAKLAMVEAPLTPELGLNLSYEYAYHALKDDPTPEWKDPEWARWTTDTTLTSAAGFTLKKDKTKVGASYQLKLTEQEGGGTAEEREIKVNAEVPLVDAATLSGSIRFIDRGEFLNYADLAVKYPVGDFSLTAAFSLRQRFGSNDPLKYPDYIAREFTLRGAYAF